ncbi:DNA polymerase III subunit beta [Nocardioides bizhenqiangii]|uniref:Beta sliding clamp n=1 Tax=Nocardioides bizhenqiangii TaxID=3095076 RepID=A0ABZ0ZT10_9ACTN|nr:MULTISPECIES: DNA polymerase III subunit beta [unclassified Nocardioides]MDZ5619346.1 DNA polymerase III subunit beta [Nocardioides sp. HM23]WQQ26633.1 DNA polymerase III subunit beta [Nocardioides sp. HM61]
MKFRVDRDVFADAVAWAARSLPVRPSAPVLAGLLIEAGDGTNGGLVLSTFDYETSCRATLTAEVSDEGSALVSGRLLADICRSLPAKPIDVMLDGARVSLTCGSARFSLQTMPVEDYPSIPSMPAATGTVPSEAFAHAVAQAVTAAGRDDMLPVLTGVRLEIEGDTIALLATDRFRLAQRELAWAPGQPDASLAALVPAKVLGDTAKSLTAGPEVTIALSATGSGDGLIGFEGSGPGGVRRTTTRLLDGEFPKVRSLFPSERLTIAKLDKAVLVEALKRVSLVAERNTAVQLAFKDGVLTLDAGSGDEAQASESIEAQIEGDDLVTGFNPQFLLDGLGAIDEPVVELAFTQASKPVVITGTADESASDTAGAFRYLLMPRRLLG